MFARGLARELAQSLGTLRPGARVVLSRRVSTRWGVAALAGERIVDGKREPYSYGAALVRERGRWRVDLGGVVFAALEPEPAAEVSGGSRVRARAEAGGRVRILLLWVDGRPVAADADGLTPFSAEAKGTLYALEPGRHDAIAFAATASEAGAVAWPFVVRD